MDWEQHRAAWAAVLIYGLLSAEVSAMPRLSPEAACEAMRAHIADLLDQHRRSDDLDDTAFDRVLRLFYDAQAACALGRFSEGMDIYTAIPIGRVSHQPLR